MTQDPTKTDYRASVFLPTTDFPMKAGLPQKEPGLLARWQDQQIYQKLRDSRRGREKFILHDGPPYANGDMHIGHALNHILKDMVCRTQTLLGKDAPYVPGWDCHGLPIEWKVEEQYRKKKLNKDEVPVKEFRAECRAYAQHWVNTQREQLKRLGINGDWDNPYLTMDFAAEATIVSELLKFAESGQLYRGAKPVMWSPVEKTALAEAEIEYEDIVSTQVDVAFEIVSSPIAELVGAYAVIWTTTPWTIPVNQAIAYGPDVEYVLVNFDISAGPADGRQELTPLIIQGVRSEKILIAADLFGSVRDRLFDIEHSVDTVVAQRGNIVWRGKGSDLAGTIARHPMATLLRHSRASGNPASLADGEDGKLDPRFRGGDAEWGRAIAFYEKPRPFLPGDFVTTDSGTGLVHMAPDHGEDDFDLCKAHGIDPVFAVTADGKYRDDWAWLGGQGSVINPKFNAPEGPICSDLRDSGGLLAASEDYRHSYPHSWRSKAKVIYRCTPQWFVPMDRSMNAVRPEPAEGRTEGAGSPFEKLRMSGPSQTLRQTATQAIADTRWVPAKGENRIRSMVEGRPDWVLSRQRAWGVPITLFVNRKTGQYLCDAHVNARIIAAVREQGVDAWCDERAQDYLGDAYSLADYERIVDILDVWFDSGCTHSFVLESGRWPDLQWPADLYLEGSDQHRGWFQSSLLQSCGTRGRAPYKAVLTHGFTMDSKGLKMSKSLGNTIDPLKVMETNGADIIRLWALTVDYTEDHRIGDEILKGVADQYRKLRNTFRYMLGALDGFSDAEKVTTADMPELEKYILHLLADMDGKLKTAINDFDFNTYVRLISDFANEDLSAFFFDIRKDCLYCDAPSSLKRRAYRTVLDILFHALIRYAAPVIVFTAEEIWATRFPDAGSVHLLEWPEVDADWFNSNIFGKWRRLAGIKSSVNLTLEGMRRNKEIGSSLEAGVNLQLYQRDDFDSTLNIDLAELLIVSEASAKSSTPPTPNDKLAFHYLSLIAGKSTNAKCSRCWRHLPDVGSHADHPELCTRCHDVVTA